MKGNRKPRFSLENLMRALVLVLLAVVVVLAVIAYNNN